jgi:very-short-patch-repair endonuclease
VDWSNLKADYERLGSYAAVAAEYGVSKPYVAQQAKKQGINPKPEGRSLKTDWSGLPELYDSGMNFAQLAEHYGCSVHAIQNAVRRLGVQARPQGLPEGYEWTEERRTAHRAAVDRPEWRAKNRENLLKRLPTMRGPSANSPLEKLLQAALLKIGLSFSTQRVLLGRYCVDILIEQKPIVIEADGALHYLHKEKDAKRDADLLDAGYRVFRFTGSQINRDALGCIGEVAEAAGLIPDSEPVADIRTGMMGAENPNSAGPIDPPPCEYCGALTARYVYRVRAMRQKFCNEECYGSWLPVHPEAKDLPLRRGACAREMARLYETGMPLSGVASEIGCDWPHVRNALLRAGVTMRSRGGPNNRRKPDSVTVRAGQ